MASQDFDGWMAMQGNADTYKTELERQLPESAQMQRERDRIAYDDKPLEVIRVPKWVSDQLSEFLQEKSTPFPCKFGEIWTVSISHNVSRESSVK